MERMKEEERVKESLEEGGKERVEENTKKGCKTYKNLRNENCVTTVEQVLIFFLLFYASKVTL